MQILRISSQESMQQHSLVLVDSQALTPLIDAGLAVKLPNALHKGVVHQILWWNGSGHGELIANSKFYKTDKILLHVKHGEFDIEYVLMHQIHEYLAFLSKYHPCLNFLA